MFLQGATAFGMRGRGIFICSYIQITSTAITRAGDVWKLDKHRVSCGNALHDGTYRTLMGSKRAAGVFTDPPFNVRIDGHATGNGAIQHREFVMASGEMSEAEFVSFLTNAIDLIARYSVPNAIAPSRRRWRHGWRILEQPNAGTQTCVCSPKQERPPALAGGLFRSGQSPVCWGT